MCKEADLLSTTFPISHRVSTVFEWASIASTIYEVIKTQLAHFTYLRMNVR